MTTTRQNLADQIYFPRQTFADVGGTISSRVVIAAITQLTASRTLTLPPANQYTPDTPLEIVDESGALTSAITVSIAAAGTDKINGLASLSGIIIPYFSVRLASDGNSKWTIRSFGLASAGNNLNAVGGYTTAAADAAFGKRRNFCVDPGFRISQENVNNSVSPSNGGVVWGSDSIFLGRNGSTGAATIQRVAISTLTPGGSPFFVRITCTAANASPAAGDYLFAGTRIEGLDCAPLKFGTSAPKSLCYRAALRSSLAGTFPIAIINGAFNRSYVGSVTFSAADVGNFVVKSIFLTADTTGTWTQDNSIGLQAYIGLQAGTNYQTSANSWQGGGYFGLASGTNFMATANATFDIADVGIYDVTGLTSGVIPPFELDEFQRDLLKCQRYYAKTYSQGVTPGTVTDVDAIWFTQDSANAYQALNFEYPVEMRTVPSLTIFSPATGATGLIRLISTNVDISATSTNPGRKRVAIYGNGTNSGASQYSYYAHAVVNARM